MRYKDIEENSIELKDHCNKLTVNISKSTYTTPVNLINQPLNVTKEFKEGISFAGMVVAHLMEIMNEPNASKHNDIYFKLYIDSIEVYTVTDYFVGNIRFPDKNNRRLGDDELPDNVTPVEIFVGQSIPLEMKFVSDVKLSDFTLSSCIAFGISALLLVSNTGHQTSRPFSAALLRNMIFNMSYSNNVVII